MPCLLRRPLHRPLPHQLSLLATTLLLPLAAWAEGPGYFWGLDVSAGTASGSSRTTNGGAAFAGGGVVRDVKLGGTTGVGGHVGYRLDDRWSLFASYQRVQGSVSWSADFPAFGVTSDFAGKAVTHSLLANAAYRWPVSQATSLHTRVGLGLAANVLAGVVETDRGTGIFLSDVAQHTRLSPMALVGVGLQHQLARNVTLGLDLSVAYSGAFQTGATRTGNLGVTDITPYKLDKVWRTGLGASLRVDF